MSIKTVIFADNPAGITRIEIDTENWTIRSTCAALPIFGRHCRLTQQGSRLEYRDGDSYRAVQADIKMVY